MANSLKVMLSNINDPKNKENLTAYTVTSAKSLTFAQSPFELQTLREKSALKPENLGLA